MTTEYEVSEGMAAMIENRPQLSVRKRGSQDELFDERKVSDTVRRCASGLDGLDVGKVVGETKNNVFSGVSTSDLEQAMIFSAASFIELDPSYSYLAARLLTQKIRKEALGVSVEAGTARADQAYRKSLFDAIRVGIEKGLLDPRMGEFDLEFLSSKLAPDRDNLLKYLGVQTLYERYLLKHGGRRIELPQVFWMRIAMGLALQESPADRNGWAAKFYDGMSKLLFVPSTPTLFHSGTTSPQMSSCFLSTVADDLRAIVKSTGDNAQLSKWSGGVATDYTPLRSCGAFINTTKVDSQGVIPFLKVEDVWTIAINRSGKRRGAKVVYLETWHLDIEDFLDLRKNTGDERRRTPDLDTANWIPDLFVKRYIEDASWTLFSPEEVPDLHDLHGRAFDERYVEYEGRADLGLIKLFKRVSARKLGRKMLGRLFETGHPWWCFKDPCNIRSPQDHVGVVHSSNLCCVAGDQRVACQLGLPTVRELYALGIPLSVAGRGGVVEATPMLLPRPNAPMRKIVTAEGYTHKVTPDHKVWVVGHGHKEAQDLVVGDRIGIQSREGMWGNDEIKDEAFLMGLIAGGGAFGPGIVHVNLRKGNSFSAGEIESIAARVIEKNLHRLDVGPRCSLTSQFSVSEDGEKVRMSSSLLSQVLDTVFGFNEGTRLEVPKRLWVATKESVSRYLNGLYIGDGAVECREFATLSVPSASKSFLEEVQLLWANFGCKTSLAKSHDGRGGENSHRPSHVLRLGGAGEKGREQELFGTFIELEELPNEDAYCVSVDSDDHLWTCNGILTKNTEITENTSVDEVAVCNLASIVVSNHIVRGGDGAYAVDWDQLRDSVRLAMRGLDNVIDLNFYPVPEAQVSNSRHRPVGLGSMGWQDALYRLDIDYEDSGDFQDELQEFIAYHAIEASSDLASERGAYSTFAGSKWDRGIFPLDTLDLLERERGYPTGVPRSASRDWGRLKAKVKAQGMRNSNTQAQAPTATIANIAGVTPCAENTFKNVFVKANMSGEFVVVNEYLVADLKAIGLWDKRMLDDIKFRDGSVQGIIRIPARLRAKYKEAFEIDQFKSVDLCARRGKWVDQSQSFNIFFRGREGNDVEAIYLYAWAKGLKTTYYLRTLGASQTEKSTLGAEYGLTQKRDSGSYLESLINNSNVPEPPPGPEGVGGVKLCRINDPTCESCQ